MDLAKLGGKNLINTSYEMIVVKPYKSDTISGSAITNAIFCMCVCYVDVNIDNCNRECKSNIKLKVGIWLIQFFIV